MEVDGAVELKRRWEGTGNEVRLEAVPRYSFFQVQRRPEFARPAVGGTRELAVRQALYHAIDRERVVEAAMYGLAPAADSWLRPDDPLRRDVEAVIPQYPFDRARAQRLLEQAGWTRGGDGILVHSQTGERFETEVWAIPQASEKAITVVAERLEVTGDRRQGLSHPLQPRPGPWALDGASQRSAAQHWSPCAGPARFPRHRFDSQSFQWPKHIRLWQPSS